MLFSLVWAWTEETAGGLTTLASLVLYAGLSLGLTDQMPPNAIFLILPLAAGAAFLMAGLGRAK